jgi:aspartate kinase
VVRPFDSRDHELAQSRPLDDHVTVLKIGGSVLTSLDAYRHAASSLAALVVPGVRRIVAVVSAQEGHTDALLAEARAFGATPDADTLDLLWSTGELRSVALLTLALQSLGVRAIGVNVHESGIRAAGRDAGSVTMNAIGVRSQLSSHDVVVIPGFLAARGQRVTTLGRGGSDWSAVLVAAHLGASRCDLIKDVDGYFTSDPHVDASATRIDAIDYDDALALADRGGPLVQRQAIAAARDAGVRLVVRSFTSAGTAVGAAPLTHLAADAAAVNAFI